MALSLWLRESVTLLQNNGGILPLTSLTAKTILVVGPSADSLVLQSGGWTIHWHGATDDDEFW